MVSDNVKKQTNKHILDKIEVVMDKEDLGACNSNIMESPLSRRKKVNYLSFSEIPLRSCESCMFVSIHLTRKM